MTDRIIRNRDELLDGPEVELRRAALDIVEGAIADVHPRRLLDDYVNRSATGVLSIDGTEYNINDADRIFVVGAGKGSQALVEVVVDLLREEVEVTKALAVEKAGQVRETDCIQVIEAGHPLPTDRSMEAADTILEMADEMTNHDLVFVCITGGASSLLAAPDDVSLTDLRTTTNLLLRSGAPIEEINAVRKQLSQIKGGRLAERITPARGISFIVVDEVGGEPWGPTVSDRTHPEVAIDVLKHYELWESIPKPVRTSLLNAEPRTIEDSDTVDNFVLATAADVCQAAVKRAQTLDFNPLLLSTMIEGESCDIGLALAGISKEVSVYNRPIERPGALISGGETTVTVTEPAGRGGPNQEAALGFAQGISGREGIVSAFVGTDGTDGPTRVAGGIVDGRTVDRAGDQNQPVRNALKTHNSTTVLKTLGDAICMNSTQTNLMDLRVVLVQ